MQADIILHIVDDDEAVRRSLVFLCSSAGYAVRPHDSATDFLALAPSVMNGCLLADLRMPDMNGVELLQKLRDIGAELPTVVITGDGDVKMAVEAMKLGAVDFVEKPFIEAVLLEAIERAVGRAQSALSSAQAREAVMSRLNSLSDRENQVLDGILDAYITRSLGRADVVALGFDAETVDFVIRLVDRSEWKRRQGAIGPKISGIAFGRDRRLPITYRPTTLA